MRTSIGYAVALAHVYRRITVEGVLTLWQNLQLAPGPNDTFYSFCDALEVKDGEVAGEDGWGLEHALAAWGSYYQDGPFLQNGECSLPDVSFVRIDNVPRVR